MFQMVCVGCQSPAWSQHDSSCLFFVDVNPCHCADHLLEVKYRGHYWSYELRNSSDNIQDAVVPNPYQSDYESIMHEIMHKEDHTFVPRCAYQRQILNRVLPIHLDTIKR